MLNTRRLGLWRFRRRTRHAEDFGITYLAFAASRRFGQTLPRPREFNGQFIQKMHERGPDILEVRLKDFGFGDKCHVIPRRHRLEQRTERFAQPASCAIARHPRFENFSLCDKTYF